MKSVILAAAVALALCYGLNSGLAGLEKPTSHAKGAPPAPKLSGDHALAMTAADQGASRIDPQQFAKLHPLIKPESGEEKWQEIPWMISLWEARKKAAWQGKPILLWEMDGHPLGCT